VLSDEAHCHLPTRKNTRIAETADLPILIDSFARPGVVNPGHSQPSGTIMAIGTVKFFNSSKGFGFIAPEDGGKDIFVHATALEVAGMTSLSEGQRVSYEVQPDAKGSKAVNLKSA
jgi:CspA family cold shock protein